MIPGLSGTSQMVVQEGDLVSRLGGVDVDVLSTPRLIQLMEAAALAAIKDFFPADQLSLGARVNIAHLAATPIGMKVTAHALLRKVEKNHLFFVIDAFDEKEKVAEGEHERIVVTKERFLERIVRKGAQ